MAARSYKVALGDTKNNATANALVGTETIDASVAAGEVAIIVQGGTTVNTVMLTQTINRLRDFLMESNK